MRSGKIGVAGVAVALLVLSSGPVPPAWSAEQDSAPSAVEEPETEAAEEEEQVAGRGPRDPFRPFNLDFGADVDDQSPKTPLEQYELGSLTLVAVIWNVSDPKAMVEDDAGLGYTVGVGTPIGRRGGVIKQIEPDRVVVEEESVDFYGEKKKKDVVLKLKPEGEKRP